jgi:DNA replication protein DnaC
MAVCEHCGGTGWKIVESNAISGAQRCNCATDGLSEVIETRARIPENYRNASLENFKLPRDNSIAQSQLASVLLVVRAFIRDFPVVNRQGLLFVGDTGTGKTHLAVAALRGLMQKGFPGLFFDYQDLLEKIRGGFSSESGVSREAYQFALDAEILLLDDLGAHRVTDFVEDTVASIITYRCNNRKPLIVTTNLEDRDMTGPLAKGAIEVRDTLTSRIGQRARSRLFEMCKVVPMPRMADYRVASQALWG